MAFVKVVKTGIGSHSSIHEIRMGSQLANGKASRSIYMSITRDIIEEVGWTMLDPPNVSKVDRKAVFIFVNEGIEEDAGFWMIEETDERKGHILGSNGKPNTSFNATITTILLKHYVLNDYAVEPAPVEFSVDQVNHTLLIQCPDWLRYNSLTVPPKKPEQIVPSPSVPVGRMHTSVSTPVGLNREQRRQTARTIVDALKK